MKRFFGTTLAILSVYAVWAECYAEPKWNSIALASKHVNEEQCQTRRGNLRDSFAVHL
jgi:hypothetical protein